MKNQILFSVLILLMFQINWAQINEPGNTKVYTDINQALSEPEKVIRLNLSNQNRNWEEQDFGVFKNLSHLFVFYFSQRRIHH